MAVIVILEVKAKPGTGNDLVSTFKELLPDTRAYEGIIDINVLQNQDDPDSLIAYERWETRAHYEKYLAWRTETGVIDALDEATVGEPSIRYFDVTDA